MKRPVRRVGAADHARGPKLRWDRSLTLTLFAAAGLLLILGVIFSAAFGSKQITTNAAALHDADESLRAATVVRAQLALSIHAATVDREFGSNSSEAIQLSLADAGTAVSDLRTGLGRLEASGTLSEELALESERFLSLSENVMADLAAGRKPTEISELQGAFEGVTQDLVELRKLLSAKVEQSDALLGRIGNFARFLVAFLVPLAVILIYRELLKRQHKQLDLESRLSAARELNKAREEFVANASHELRTPLTSIIGLSLLLAESPTVAQDESARELLSIIINESDDLARMVEDLLTTARLDSGALHFVFEDVAVHEEMAETIDPFTRSGEVVAVDCDPGVVRADVLRFRQLVRNLISNARKYGGDNVRIEGRVEDRTYLCAVVDDGDGIRPEIEDRLFERFIHQGHQTATKDSVGLGLSIVHALAQGMGGSVKYRRSDGETRFEIRLPLAEATRVSEGPEHLSRAGLSREAA